MTDLLTDKELLAELLEERSQRQKERKLFSYFPDEGPLRRELYKKHLMGFSAMKTARHVWMMAGNRTGKTESWMLYAVALAATGLYPEWWPGRKWDRPIKAWLAGKTGTTTRDILQTKLLGPHNEQGTGLIPKKNLLKTTAKSGIAEAVDTLYIKHISGGTSVIQFKSYDQGRKAFEGTEQDIIGFDEEPPTDVYEEATIRTGTTGGSIWASFTPLEGLTALIVNEFPDGFPDGLVPEGLTHTRKHIVTMDWDDVPHLTADDKKELWDNIAPHLREARKKGVPAVGAGLIYPVAPEDYQVDPIPIPETWKKAFGFDVGWNKTAAVFGAIDPNTDILYIYDVHYKGQAEPAIHAQAIKNRGEWMPGVVDPAARGRSQVDGRKLIDEYKLAGLDLYWATNYREAGILKVWQSLTTGKLKIFNTLTPILQEIRLYRRDDDGEIVKENDHALDALRYLVMSGLELARVSPVARDQSKRKQQQLLLGGYGGEAGWMGV